MVNQLHTLENEFWQVGILPETGASIAFGRVRRGDTWVDVMRPTDPADYGNSSNCASFIMIPWSNRIRDGKMRFNGVDYQLQVNSGDGTAIHGDVRKRAWHVDHADATRIDLSINSADFADRNFPFAFSAAAGYRLEGRDFIMDLAFKNEDTQPMPAGFGHHPYFVKTPDVQLEIPYTQQYVLTKSMPTEAPVDIHAVADFRTLRPIADSVLDHLLTGRIDTAPARIVFPEAALTFHSDAIFPHMIVFAPPGQSYFAVEPVSNINDGFNLYAQGLPNTGVFILEPGASQAGSMRLSIDV